MALVLGIPVRMVGFRRIAEHEARQQKKPRHHAERRRQRRHAQRLRRHIHRRLHEHRHHRADQRPNGRPHARLVEDRRQRDGRQHGAVTVEPLCQQVARGAERRPRHQAYGRPRSGPQRRPKVRDRQPREKERAGHPRIEQEDLRHAAEPCGRQRPELHRQRRRCGSSGQRGLAHARVGQPDHGTRGQQEDPGTKHEGKRERIDAPPSHHVIEPRAHPHRERGTEHQRQPHPHAAAQKGGEGAPHQYAVEAPESVVAVPLRQTQHAARGRRRDQAEQCAPRHDPVPAGIGAPEDTAQEQQSRPRIALKHHLPRTAEQHADPVAQPRARDRVPGFGNRRHNVRIVLQSIARSAGRQRGALPHPTAERVQN